MESYDLKIVNKALKIAVNTVPEETMGFKTLLEAKDILEKQMKELEAPPPLQNAPNGKGGKTLSTESFVILVNEVMNRKCLNLTKFNIAGTTCRQTWPKEADMWCGQCYVKQRVGL